MRYENRSYGVKYNKIRYYYGRVMIPECVKMKAFHSNSPFCNSLCCQSKTTILEISTRFESRNNSTTFLSRVLGNNAQNLSWGLWLLQQHCLHNISGIHELKLTHEFYYVILHHLLYLILFTHMLDRYYSLNLSTLVIGYFCKSR